RDIQHGLKSRPRSGRISSIADRHFMVAKTSGRWFVRAMIGLAALQTLGCSEKVTQTSHYSDLQDAGTSPQVLSSKQQRDVAAYQDSEQKLTEVQWGVIEKKGPKPVWERLQFDRHHNDQLNTVDKEPDARTGRIDSATIPPPAPFPTTPTTPIASTQPTSQ